MCSHSCLKKLVHVLKQVRQRFYLLKDKMRKLPAQRKLHTQMEGQGSHVKLFLTVTYLCLYGVPCSTPPIPHNKTPATSSCSKLNLHKPFVFKIVTVFLLATVCPKQPLEVWHRWCHRQSKCWGCCWVKYSPRWRGEVFWKKKLNTLIRIRWENWKADLFFSYFTEK